MKSFFKTVIIRLAVWGVIPATLAILLIRWGGLKHV
jgi:hypothetical protein